MPLWPHCRPHHRAWNPYRGSLRWGIRHNPEPGTSCRHHLQDAVSVLHGVVWIFRCKTFSWLYSSFLRYYRCCSFHIAEDGAAQLLRIGGSPLNALPTLEGGIFNADGAGEAGVPDGGDHVLQRHNALADTGKGQRCDGGKVVQMDGGNAPITGAPASVYWNSPLRALSIIFPGAIRRPSPIRPAGFCPSLPVPRHLPYQN